MLSDPFFSNVKINLCLLLFSSFLPPTFSELLDNFASTAIRFDKISLKIMVNGIFSDIYIEHSTPKQVKFYRTFL